MLRETPNLDWLRVFAETATTESFAMAASRLNVTPGAVSQRIKALEAFLGVSLFQRYPQGVKLTEVGKRYAQRVAPALDQLTTATREITTEGSAKTVRVTVLPALAQLWLGPKLNGFHTLHPGTTVEIWADAHVVDMRSSNFDVAIRYGKPPFAGCDYQELLFDELVPVASPALVKASELDDCGLPIGAPLMLDPYWEHDFTDWLTRTGMVRRDSITTQSFSLYSMIVEATLEGRGFMIGHMSLIADLVEQGRLVTLDDTRTASNNHFYLVTKTSVPLSDPAQRFVNWILDQAGT